MDGSPPLACAPKSTQSMRTLTSNAPYPPSEPSAQKLFDTIRKTILDTAQSVDLSFEKISPGDGFQVATSLSVDPDVERALPRYIISNTYTGRFVINV